MIGGGGSGTGLDAQKPNGVRTSVATTVANPMAAPLSRPTRPATTHETLNPTADSNTATAQRIACTSTPSRVRHATQTPNHTDPPAGHHRISPQRSRLPHPPERSRHPVARGSPDRAGP